MLLNVEIPVSQMDQSERLHDANFLTLLLLSRLVKGLCIGYYVSYF